MVQHVSCVYAVISSVAAAAKKIAARIVDLFFIVFCSIKTAAFYPQTTESSVFYKLTLVVLCISYSLVLVCSEQKTGQYNQLNAAAIELQTSENPNTTDHTPGTKTAAPKPNAMSDQQDSIARIQAEDQIQDTIDCAKQCCCVIAAGICCVGTFGTCTFTACGQDFEEYNRKLMLKRDQRKALFHQLLAQYKS